MRTRSLLLEIGTEEIPARFIPGAMEALERAAPEALRQVRIGFGAVRAYATPRRLAVVVEGLSSGQKDLRKEVFGPPRQAAFDADGKPTKAAVGFAKSQGVDVSALSLRQREGKGEYVCAVVEEKGRPTSEILPAALRELVLGLQFPKSMRWGDGSIRFVRPIHWVLALYGSSVLEFELDGIKSDGRSRGHRFLSPRPFRVKSPGDYLKALEARSVMADKGMRERAIKEQAEELCSTVSGRLIEDDELLSIVSCLVEYPQSVLCEYPAEYLKLPPELLTAVMRGHQKYFSVGDGKGGLLNRFVVVSNTRAENRDMVKAGAERVIRARFEDARFYYEDDLKTPLPGRVEGLARVTFQDRLGSLHDKTMRVVGLSGAIAGRLCPERKEAVVRAALLSKTDLVTGVVREFPELQGVMGMYYARSGGEPEDVAVALREQYLPGFSGDRVPGSDVGTVLGLADKLDNIAAFFSIGLKPTGSEDPFALRRQALGSIAILMEKGYAVSLEEIIGLAVSNLSGIAGASVSGEELAAFFQQRVEPLLSSRGYTHDLVQAVIPYAYTSPLSDLPQRVEALKKARLEPGFEDFLLAIKRVRNIVEPAMAQGAGAGRVDGALFSEPQEVALFGAFESLPVEEAVRLGDYGTAISELGKLTGPINDFFDKVLVMAEDRKVRDNRLCLLGHVWRLALVVADFSKLRETSQAGG